MEREVTGVYITGHPLDEYEAELSKLEVNSQVLQGLSEEADGGMAWDQKLVSMGGIVAERKLKATKSGTMMAFVQLEDMYGLTEVLVFPKVYDRVGHLLSQDAAVLLTGRLSVREEESPKLLLDSVRPLGGGEAASRPAAAREGGRPQTLHQVPGRPARGGARHPAANAGEHPRDPRQRRNGPRPARAAEVLGGRGLRLLPSGEPFGGEERRIQIDGHRGGRKHESPGALHRHPLLQ